MLGDLVGGSAPMRQVFSLISQVAPTTASVLITGESGTGKELVARALHRLSPRAGGPFVPINCAALTETLIEAELFGHEKGAFTGALERHSGCFEQANNGTVFLDEIGDMPFGTQAKLLRVLEERKVRRLGGKSDLPVEVRVVAATNKIPEDAIKDKLLREDLYYRLNVFSIYLPPLRERREDIAPISEAIITNLNKKHGCRVTGLASGGASTYSSATHGPETFGNFINMLERAVIIAGEGVIHRKGISLWTPLPPRPRRRSRFRRKPNCQGWEFLSHLHRRHPRLWKSIPDLVRSLWRKASRSGFALEPPWKKSRKPISTSSSSARIITRPKPRIFSESASELFTTGWGQLTRGKANSAKGRHRGAR